MPAPAAAPESKWSLGGPARARGLGYHDADLPMGPGSLFQMIMISVLGYVILLFSSNRHEPADPPPRPRITGMTRIGSGQLLRRTPESKTRAPGHNSVARVCTLQKLNTPSFPSPNFNSESTVTVSDHVSAVPITVTVTAGPGGRRSECDPGLGPWHRDRLGVPLPLAA